MKARATEYKMSFWPWKQDFLDVGLIKALQDKRF